MSRKVDLGNGYEKLMPEFPPPNLDEIFQP